MAYAEPDFLAYLRAVLAQRQRAGSRSSPPDIADLRPRHTDIGSLQPRPSVGFGPVGEDKSAGPFTRVPNRRYYTYRRDINMLPGTQLRFTRGLGYWRSGTPRAGQGYRF
jgi:hypothetical protein